MSKPTPQQVWDNYRDRYCIRWGESPVWSIAYNVPIKYQLSVEPETTIEFNQYSYRRLVEWYDGRPDLFRFVIKCEETGDIVDKTPMLTRDKDNKIVVK